MTDDAVGRKQDRWTRADHALFWTALAALVTSAIIYRVAAERYVEDPDGVGRATSLAVAGILLSGGVVGVLIGWFTRRVNDAARARELRRGFIRETLEVHALVKAAAFRLTTYRSAKAYSEAMRDLIIPARAQLGGVISEIRYHLNPGKESKLEISMGKCMRFLDGLLNEFAEQYLIASRIQERAEPRRKAALEGEFEHVDLDELLCFAGTFADFRSSYPWLAVDSAAWDLLDNRNWFPALNKLVDHKCDHGDYVTYFSDPIREMLARLDP